jgi:hypothetical protein
MSGKGRPVSQETVIQVGKLRHLVLLAGSGGVHAHHLAPSS